MVPYHGISVNQRIITLSSHNTAWLSGVAGPAAHEADMKQKAQENKWPAKDVFHSCPLLQ